MLLQQNTVAESHGILVKLLVLLCCKLFLLLLHAVFAGVVAVKDGDELVVSWISTSRQPHWSPQMMMMVVIAVHSYCKARCADFYERAIQNSIILIIIMMATLMIGDN